MPSFARWPGKIKPGSISNEIMSHLDWAPNLLTAAGVSFEDRQDLLGHRSGRITTHYSAAELSRLIEAANRVCGRSGKKPELVVLHRLSSR